VASIFIERFVNLLHRKLDRPGLGVHGRIGHRSAVDDQVRSRPRELFGNAQVLVGDSVVLISETALLVEPEVSRLDDQGVSFPLALLLGRVASKKTITTVDLIRI
jgi:hypothetical protein